MSFQGIAIAIAKDCVLSRGSEAEKRVFALGKKCFNMNVVRKTTQTTFAKKTLFNKAIDDKRYQSD